jgi:cellulose synthase/poly-beta-1,6-N-acetylglucosamine synthase-like glycosyltransferase
VKSPAINLFPAAYDSMIGAGVLYRGRELTTHTTRDFRESALQTVVPWQKAFIFVSLGITAFGLIFYPLPAATMIVSLLSLVYFADVLFNLFLVFRSLHYPPEINLTKKEIQGLDDSSLPLYTILCPLYREEEVLPQFVRGVEALDWPKDKLEVLLLLEENDRGTRRVAESLDLPNYFKIVVVPDSQPKTKPKACNFGLCQSSGEFLVIYDAEDRPEQDQLKKAYLGFQKVFPKTVCLQAKLNYYNPNQNLLTKLFTAEYCLWFDVILPGLQTAETIIPLGGTSNHFKKDVLMELGGWDPFNVTEDCDLGVRLFLAGYQTAMIESVTWEEANSNLKNWLRQRSRWIKGYWQTYLVHMRNPIDLFLKQRTHALAFQLVIGARMTFILINPILWLMTAAYFLFNRHVGAAIEAIYPLPVFYLASICLVFGNFMYFYDYMIGCAKREKWELIRYIFLIPGYWLLTSIAAGLAFYQLVFKPHFWEKTIHGLHLQPVGARPAFGFRPVAAIILFFHKLFTFFQKA